MPRLADSWNSGVRGSLVPAAICFLSRGFSVASSDPLFLLPQKIFRSLGSLNKIPGAPNRPKMGHLNDVGSISTYKKNVGAGAPAARFPLALKRPKRGRSEERRTGKETSIELVVCKTFSSFRGVFRVRCRAVA